MSPALGRHPTGAGTRMFNLNEPFEYDAHALAELAESVVFAAPDVLGQISHLDPDPRSQSLRLWRSQSRPALLTLMRPWPRKPKQRMCSSLRTVRGQARCWAG